MIWLPGEVNIVVLVLLLAPAPLTSSLLTARLISELSADPCVGTISPLPLPGLLLASPASCLLPLVVTASENCVLFESSDEPCVFMPLDHIDTACTLVMRGVPGARGPAFSPPEERLATPAGLLRYTLSAVEIDALLPGKEPTAACDRCLNHKYTAADATPNEHTASSKAINYSLAAEL